MAKQPKHFVVYVADHEDGGKPLYAAEVLPKQWDEATIEKPIPSATDKSFIVSVMATFVQQTTVKILKNK